MKVRITLEFDKLDRRAINNYMGQDGLADYKTVANFIDRTVAGELETLRSDLDDEDLSKYEE